MRMAVHIPTYLVFRDRCATLVPRVRVRTTSRPKKKRAHPARVAKVEQENIETMHKPKPIQAEDTLCMDRVAVL